MQHVVRSLALALTAITALGAAAPVAASAATHDGAVVIRRAGTTDVERARDRLLAKVAATRQEVADKQATVRDSDLTADQQNSLLMGTGYDLRSLAALQDAVANADSIEVLRGLAADLRVFYPRVYDVYVMEVDRAGPLAARIAENDLALVDLREGYADRARTANEAARSEVAAIQDSPLQDPTARDGRRTAAELRGLRAAAEHQLRVFRQVVGEEHRFVRLQGRVQQEAYDKQLQLSQVRAKVAGSELSDDQKIALGSAIEHTELELSDLLSHASAVTSIDELLPLVTLVDRFYPHADDTELAVLLQAPRLEARIAQNSAELAAVTDRDVSAGVAANAAAATALARALQTGGELIDDPTRPGARAVRAQLTVVHQQLRIVGQVLAGD